MRVPVLLVAASLVTVLAPVAAADLLGDDALDPLDPLLSGRLLVGYEPGHEENVLSGIRAAGGTVERVHPELRLAVVDAGAGLDASLLSLAGVEWVETDDAIALSGAEWNGAQWNGAQWNGAEWNGAEWNGAEWNGLLPLTTLVDDPGIAGQYGLEVANVPPAWEHGVGTRSAKLCVIDSGVDPEHPDISPNLWRDSDGSYGLNTVRPSQPPLDDAGHGTHVAGIAAGAVRNAWGIAGVANVQIMSVKVLDAEGQGRESDLAWGISWCARQGADVTLMALHATEAGPALDRAIRFAAARDVLHVASAGNAGCDGCVAYPASHQDVMAVAAVDAASLVAPFSSRGPQVDLAAPGVEILSTFAGGTFAYGSGTSQAAAYAAGVAALLRDSEPGLTAGGARDAMLTTARAPDLAATAGDEAYGRGIVDAAAALDAAKNASG